MSSSSSDCPVEVTPTPSSPTFDAAADLCFTATILIILLVCALKQAEHLRPAVVSRFVKDALEWSMESKELEQQLHKQRSDRASLAMGPISEAMLWVGVLRGSRRLHLLLTIGVDAVPLPLAKMAPFTLVYLAFLYHIDKFKANALIFFKTWVVIGAVYVSIAQSPDAATLELAMRMGPLFLFDPRQTLFLNMIPVATKLVIKWGSMSNTQLSMFCYEEGLVVCGVVMMSMLVCRFDVNEARQALDAARLARQENAVTCLVNARTDAVLELNADLCIVNPGRQLCAFLGCVPDQIRGMRFVDFLPLDADRLRFEVMCDKGLEQADQTRQMADSLNVSIRNLVQTVTFNARLFHVPMQNESAAHLIGICRTKKRDEAAALPEMQQVPDAPPQTLDIPRQAAPRAKRTPGSSSSRSSKSSKSSRSSAHGSTDSGGGTVRVVVNLMTEKLNFVNYSEAFEEFTDLDETPDLATFLGAAAMVEFHGWLHKHQNQALSSWNPRDFVRLKAGKVTLGSKRDGARYQFQVRVTFPDPLIAEEAEADNLMTISFENRTLTFANADGPRKDGPDLAALAEQDEQDEDEDET